MEDLRWILLLVGALVIAAVYFSSRFEREDWVREREQFDARKQSSKTASKKAPEIRPTRPQQTMREEFSPPPRTSAAPQVRKEPQMTSERSEVSTAKNNPPPIAPAMMIDEEDDTSIAFDSTLLESVSSSASSATVDSGKEFKIEPELASSPAATSTVPDLPSTPVEEKIIEEPSENDEKEVTKTSSDSEIPTEVILAEESVSEFSMTFTEKKNQDETSEARDEMPGLSIRSGIEDEITGIDIPADLAIAEAELHTSINKENQQNKKPESKSTDITLPPNIEPLVLVLSVMAEDEPFTGSAVKEALEAEGLRHGEMRIFHCFDESLDLETTENNFALEEPIPVFSVASLVEPGYFELDKINDMEIPGLTLFCQLPGPMLGTDAFNIMLDKGRGIAVRLHGQLCDDKRNRFTTQAKTHYQDRIATFARELSIARKKADV